MSRHADPLSRRGLARTPDGQLHYRVVGDGPAVILLADLPTCVRADDPLFALLGAGNTVLAVDPPGHGLSDPPRSGRGLDPFTDPLAAFIEALKCGPVPVVGQGRGGALALALLDARPDLVARVLARGLPAADDPGLSFHAPAIDGTHLLAQWDGIARARLFQPITSTRYADRILADFLSPGEHHARLIDALRAGAEGERLRVALRELDAVAVRARNAGRVDLFATDEETVVLLGDRVGREPNMPPPGPVGEGFGKYLIDVPGGQLFGRGDLRPDGMMLLGLHDQAGATPRLDAFVGPFLGSRPVLSIDMPGSGGSDPLLAPEEISIEAYATTVDAGLRSLGVDALDVIGRYSGGQTAVELALRRPKAVRHVVNAGVMIFDDADRAEHIAHYAPSIAPSWDGSHLVTAWMAFRSQNLWWPWYDRRAAAIIRRDARLDPCLLHDRIVNALAAGAFYRAAYLASFRYPTAEKLRALTVPCLLADIAGTASYARVLEAKAVAPACRVADLDEDPTAWPALFASFFSSR